MLFCLTSVLYQSAAFVLLTELPSNFYDGRCCCLFVLCVRDGDFSYIVPSLEEKSWELPDR